MWKEEMDLVVHDLKRYERVRTKGLVIRKRLQLMLYSTISSTQNQMSRDLCEGGSWQGLKLERDLNGVKSRLILCKS